MPPTQASKKAELEESPTRSSYPRLRAAIEEIAERNGAYAVAVAVHDLETGSSFDLDGDRWFHAASTIKVAVLAAVFRAIAAGELLPQSRVHVRNRFQSALDGRPFRVAANRDANSAVHAAIGSTLRVSELARHMIVTSSNLATNVLVEVLGLHAIQQTLAEMGVEGIDVRRGVEDERAFEAGISNQVTAGGLAHLFRLIAERRAISPEASDAMLEILAAQEFREGIPAGLPRGTRVAHKTGDISTAAHDAGIVHLPQRRPYVVAILTEWDPEGGRRAGTIAAISRAVHDAITAGEDGGER